MDETIAVLIPIKSFNEAKERLSETLNKSERSLLMKKMAENVINSSATLPIWVVCDDDEVALWAESKNVSVIRTKETGLNAAVEAGVQILEKNGFIKLEKKIDVL